jgi:hypothetical protein
MCHFAGFETKQRMASDSSPCTQGCCQGTIEGRGYTLSCVLAYRHEHKRPENGLYRSVGADFWFHIYLRLATWSIRPVRVWPEYDLGSPPPSSWGFVRFCIFLLNRSAAADFGHKKRAGHLGGRQITATTAVGLGRSQRAAALGVAVGFLSTRPASFLFASAWHPLRLKEGWFVSIPARSWASRCWMRVAAFGLTSSAWCAPWQHVQQ